MWVVRALAQLALRLAFAVAIALGVASLRAYFAGGPFVDSLRLSCFAVGAFVVLMGAIGGAGFDRALDAKVSVISSRRLSGWMRTPPGEVSLSETALLVLAGTSLLATGVALS